MVRYGNYMVNHVITILNHGELIWIGHTQLFAVGSILL